jgi:hypothetical protein
MPIRWLRQLAPAGGGAGSRSQRCVVAERGGSLEFEFSPMRSQRQGEHVYANLNRRRVTMKPNNGEAARPVLVDGEGGLR